jgi:hypothetical protein
MTWARLSGAFSAQVAVRKVEQRFGLAGFARMVKLIELLATSAERSTGRVTMRASDWLDALQIGRQELDEFLAFLQAAGWLSVEQGADPAAPLSVTLANAALYLPANDGPQLFVDPVQWGDWCAVELSFPNWLIRDPHTQGLFRRWCASNVTTGEMVEAAKAAVAASAQLSPSELHEQLQAIRRQRIEQARG